MKTSDFDYQLPPEQIAQAPVEPRDASRLMVLERNSHKRIHSQFNQIGKFLRPGDILVVNRSRVIPARLPARKVPSGGKLEILLLEKIGPASWKGLVGGKGMGVGKRFTLENGVEGEVLEELGGAQRILRFDQALDRSLDQVGQVPLPPYIHRPLEDPERYQTVYAKEEGSAAAPTAGLHFTQPLIDALKGNGIGFAEVLLHVGLDTFAPVTEGQPEEHLIHREWCQLGAGAADRINACKRAGGRVIAVGTTSVRVLESAARYALPGDGVAAFEGATDLFILPGYRFRIVDAMVTNFHLPRSTLVMLVSAFAGREQILDCYQEAIEEGYRFYSFGDAMLIL